ncbi:MAG: guanine deaminase [Alphaproteobacteria bacterium]|nr:guanine deaminase [Alphaproteobacteria bacterium]
MWARWRSTGGLDLGQQPVLAIAGTAFHTPKRGHLDILEDALIEVAKDGTIATMRRAGDGDLAARRTELERAGVLITLKPGQYLLPGLVDLHIHAPQWPQMGKALHLPLADWLQKNTFPLEARFADPVFAARIYDNLVETLLANGTTTAVYFGTIHDAANLILAETCLKRGQRGFVGRVAMDDPSQCPEDYRDASAASAIASTKGFIDAVHGLAGNGDHLVRPVITPRFIPSCTDTLLTGLGRLARDCDCHVQTHCSESDWEHQFVFDRLGKSDTAALESFGLLTRHTVLAHGNFIAEEDFDRIGQAGAAVAHCPLSNFYFANAVFPLRAALGKGVHVGLGTDISGGHSPSILEACRYAVAASRALEDGVNPRLTAADRGSPGQRIDVLDAFYLATRGGAEALDIRAGRFETGCSFDALVVDTDVPHSNVIVDRCSDSLADVFQKIVYTAGRANIGHVFVAGRSVHSVGGASR